MGGRTARGGKRAQSSGAIADNRKEFNKHFDLEYKGRWTALYDAMVQPVQHVALQNLFAGNFRSHDDYELLDFLETPKCICLR